MQKRKTTLVVGGLVAVSAVVGATAGALLHALQTQQSLGQQRDALERITAERARLHEQVGALEGERRDVEARMAELRAQLSSTESELSWVRDSLEQLQTQYETLESDHTLLTQRTERLLEERQTAQNTAQQLEHENERLEQVAARLRVRYELLDRDYQRLMEQRATIGDASRAPAPSPLSQESSGSRKPVADSTGSPAESMPALDRTVELPPIVVRKDGAWRPPTRDPVQARVIDVNPTHQFLVIDKGAADGLYLGMSFDVLRDGQPIGQAVVIRVRPRVSACNIILSHADESVRPGDLAVQRHL